MLALHIALWDVLGLPLRALNLKIAMALQEMLYDWLERSERCSVFSSICSSSFADLIGSFAQLDCAPKWRIIRLYLIVLLMLVGGLSPRIYELKSEVLFCIAEGGAEWCPEVKYQVAYLLFLDCLLQAHTPLTVARDHTLCLWLKNGCYFTHSWSSVSVAVLVLLSFVEIWPRKNTNLTLFQQ